MHSPPSPFKTNKRFLLGSSLALCAVLSGTALLETSRIAAAPKTTAIPTPLTGDALAKCLAFSSPTHFKVEKLRHSVLSKTDKPIWVSYYSAEKQTPVSYSVELHKARTLFGSKRVTLEKMLLPQQKSQKHDSELSKYQGIDTRPDGRKVYFFIYGFGEGGTASCGFTTIGKYDLVLTQLWDAEDGIPDSQRIKNPSLPQKSLTKAFRQLEQVVPGLTPRI